MFRYYEGFHQYQQPNGSYFTVPARYEGLRPFQVDKPFVVHAFDRISQRPVVIKKVVLPDSFHDRQPWKRAQRELYSMLYIEDDNVVQMYSAFTQASSAEEMTEFYIVREFMQGTMQNLSPASFNEHRTVKSIFFDICRGVQYLHSMNISHRVGFVHFNLPCNLKIVKDLKPQNILMAEDGDVKLCDFGHSNGEDPNSNTPYIVQRYYRAPEIICETIDNNKTSVDIWSLGCILAELLTGRVIFPGRDHIDQFILMVRFLGNADPLFYSVMNEHARDFLLRYKEILESCQPPMDIHSHLPDEYFQGGLSNQPEECRMARDLLFRMLVINPDNRIDIQMVLSHPYLSEIWAGTVMAEEVPVPQPPQFLRTFFGFQTYFRPEEMRDEIYLKLQEFGRQYNIFTESKH
uniref:Protein kinase domain-containing protein n=1 Tax=Caenorhabditis tropicalis TaxID=1561998 RepID=A0A1I7T094_9PELO